MNTKVPRMFVIAQYGQPSRETVALQAKRQGRTCRRDFCTTRLAWTNPGVYCGVHENLEAKRNWNHRLGVHAHD